MWTRADLKSKAKLAVKSNYWGLVLVTLVLGFATGGGGSAGASRTYNYNSGGSNNGGSTHGGHFNMPDMSFILAFLAVFFVVFLIALAFAIAFDIFVRNPLEMGAQRYFIESVYKPGTYNGVNCLGTGFQKGRYSNVVKTLFLRDMYIGLWSLLLVIPGIVKAYEYRMMPYILAENPNMDPDEVFTLSKQMMNGEKWNAFILDLSFILWHIAAIFTFFLLEIFWIAPYVAMTNAYLYEALKRKPGVDYFDPLLGGRRDWGDSGFDKQDPFGAGGTYGQDSYNVGGIYGQNGYNAGNAYGQDSNIGGTYGQNGYNSGSAYGQDGNIGGTYGQNGYNGGNVYGQGSYNAGGTYGQNGYNAGNTYGQNPYNGGNGYAPGSSDPAGTYGTNGYVADNTSGQGSYSTGNIYGQSGTAGQNGYGATENRADGSAEKKEDDLFGPGGFEM